MTSRLPSIADYPMPEPGSWPKPRAEWSLDPGRAALLVHDMQEHFLERFERGFLGRLVNNVRVLRRACVASNIPVLYCGQPGSQTREERGLLWDLWGPGIVANPERDVLWPDIAPGPDDVRLEKRRYSAFHDTRLADVLRERGRDQLLVCGVYAHIGCLATAIEGFSRGIQPFVVSDATGDFSREDHLIALRQVARTCGVVISSEDAGQALAVLAVRRRVEALLAEPADGIPLDDDLEDHGLDSLRAMDLVEGLFGVVPVEAYAELAEARSLRALGTLLCRSWTEERGRAS
jgi:bifunctional isochorismate lyase/aryl carrier protein